MYNVSLSQKNIYLHLVRRTVLNNGIFIAEYSL